MFRCRVRGSSSFYGCWLAGKEPPGPDARNLKDMEAHLRSKGKAGKYGGWGKGWDAGWHGGWKGGWDESWMQAIWAGYAWGKREAGGQPSEGKWGRPEPPALEEGKGQIDA